MIPSLRRREASAAGSAGATTTSNSPADRVGVAAAATPAARTTRQTQATSAAADRRKADYGPNAARRMRQTDYVQEGRDLLERVNLRLKSAPDRYATANAVYEHPTTNAKLFVGNATLAADRTGLAALNIKRIVFCQDSDGKMYFEGDPSMRYLPFAIGKWRSAQHWRKANHASCLSLMEVVQDIRSADVAGKQLMQLSTAILSYFEPLFLFVEEELGQGNSVLIHCLAGAHRAGTAGIACL